MPTGDAVETRLIHLDAVGGIAGDMFVAAMLDAFPALKDRVLTDVRSVLPAGIGDPLLTEGFSSGIRVLRFGLAGHAHPAAADHLLDRSHRGNDHHDHHAPDHAHEPVAAPHGSHGARFVDLKRRIENASLAKGTAAEAVGILSVLAEAEARIHGVSVDDVHFHEVGDWDSLMDVVAVGGIVAALRPATWSISELPRGGGFVRTQHGLLPVPAPATVEMLREFRWRDDGVSGERVTPTGAAIVRHLCSPRDAGPAHSGRLVTSGAGAGTRDLGSLPNILRVMVFEAGEASRAETIDVISFDVDDMTGEEIAVAADRLRATEGIVDLTLQAISGKKGRPVTRFQLLAYHGDVAAVADAVFTETSTLGLRRRTEVRTVLPRTETLRSGRRAKLAERPGGERTIKLESDEVADVGGLAARRAIARDAEGTDDV